MTRRGGRGKRAAEIVTRDDRRFENQVFRASGLNLLVAAIILWNSRYLAAAFDSLGSRGQPLSRDIRKHIAPLGWEHIGLTDPR